MYRKPITVTCDRITNALLCGVFLALVVALFTPSPMGSYWGLTALLMFCYAIVLTVAAPASLPTAEPPRSPEVWHGVALEIEFNWSWGQSGDVPTYCVWRGVVVDPEAVYGYYPDEWEEPYPGQEVPEFVIDWLNEADNFRDDILALVDETGDEDAYHGNRALAQREDREQ